MSDIFRITDKYNIIEKGTLLKIEKSKGAALRTEDILFDLQGNKFRVKEIESPHANGNEILFEELSVGIIVEMLSGNFVHGNILVREKINVNYLFCNHPLYIKKVDDDYEEEYLAASENHECALFSYEDLEAGKLSLYGNEISGLTVYRGWMMKPELYKEFYNSLEQKNILLINTPEEYERYHLIPRWYEDFKGETSKSIWTEGNNIEDIKQASKELEGAYIVKDYVKSRKHEWHDACFIENIRDDETSERVIENFIERQGSDLVGGVVLRKFENLRQIGVHEQSGMPLSEEYRVFIYAGKILIIDGYWKGESELKFSDYEYKWMESIAKRINSNFVTVDLARKENGSLIIMEFGDGQVSGLQQLNAKDFYDRLR